MAFLKFANLNRPDSAPILEILLSLYIYYGDMKGDLMVTSSQALPLNIYTLYLWVFKCHNG